MADSLKTIEAKIKKQVKLLEIAENESKRLFERKRKFEPVKYLKHVETRLEIFQDLKYEGQEIMVCYLLFRTAILTISKNFTKN